MNSITQKLKEIIKKAVEEKGYEFVDIKYSRIGRKWSLQVFADKEDGIGVNDCAVLSEYISYELDRQGDLLGHSYQLEVSSPGLDKPLKTEDDFKKFKGRLIKFNLYTPLDNYRLWVGRIVQFENGKLTFEDNDARHRVIDIDNIKSANLEPEI